MGLVVICAALCELGLLAARYRADSSDLADQAKGSASRAPTTPSS
jgi:hypothetical protein